MRLEEVLDRLKAVRRAGQGWKARCPAHEDDTPSLSIRFVDGKVLFKCFVGCERDAILAALNLEDTAGPDRARGGVRGNVVPASALPAVADWLRASRGMPPSQLSTLFAARTGGGPAVVFRYLTVDGQPSYEKFRLIGEKRFWRTPKGKRALLYGLETLRGNSPERVVVVEGELDAHAVRAAGVGPVVSVPDGADSSLSPELLAPLAPFKTVVLAADADEPGDRLAGRLAALLGPERCRRLRWPESIGKDANDALRAGWGAEQFRAEIESAPAVGGVPPSFTKSAQPDERYRVIDHRICHVRRNPKGGEMVECLAGFACRIARQITFDDGFETSLQYEIRGESEDGSPLPVVRVSAADFGTLNWVAKHWGVRGVIEPGQGVRDHLRVAIMRLSKPEEATVFRHTGWRQMRERWAFLYNGGAVGAEGVSVELEAPLDRYVLPAATDNLPEAVSTSLEILGCGPLSLTVPLLGAVYLAPVSFVVEPDTTLWLQGLSGALKSTLSGLVLRHYGRFHRKALPANWTSTDNSLEYRLSVLKDVLCAIDDFTPQPSTKAQREMEGRAERVLRSVGNRASRGRMRSDLTQRPDRPPRGLLMSSGEDLPVGGSLLARLFVVEVDRNELNDQLIRDLERRGDRLGHAFRGYLEWLAPQMPRLQTELPEIHASLRDGFQGRGDHLRQPEAMAHFSLGFGLLLRYAEDTGVLTSEQREAWRKKAMHALEESAAEQTHSMRDVDIAEMMIDALRTLLEQGQVQLANEEGITRPNRGIAIGRMDGGDCFLLPRAVKQVVHGFYRGCGEHWNPSLKALGGALLRRRYIQPGLASGRNQVERRMNGGRTRGWLMPIGVLRPLASCEPAIHQGTGDEAGGPRSPDSREIPLSRASVPPHPPDPPGYGGRGTGYRNGHSRGA